MNTQEKELKHCTACNQMTNHSGETCLKHTPDTECESVAGEEIQKNSAVYRADDGKIYKSLTYPNTFSEVVEYLLERKDVLAMATKEDAKDVLTYQIGKAISSRDTYWKNHEHDMYETLEKENREQTIIDIARVRDERDTYWKEMVRKASYEIVKEFRDNLITIAIENEHLRGCVTSNQIIQAFKDFEANTHPALTNEDNLK